MNIINTIDTIINWSNTFTSSQVDEICDELTNISTNSEKNLSDIVGNINAKEIIQIFNLNNKLKHDEIKKYLMKSEKIYLTCIEDWKNKNKINLIKLLIVLNYLERQILLRLIGNKSKKTYLNGEIVQDQSLSVKKIFDDNFNTFITDFYNQFDKIKLRLICLGYDRDIISNTFREMVDFMQGDVICRDKFNLNQLSDYKNKISDIIETRNKEEHFFMLFYRVYYLKLVTNTHNEPLLYILLNGWDATKIKYYWLIHLITFINNGSTESKEYLIQNYGIERFEGSNNRSKCMLIKQVIKKLKLNPFNTNEIIDYIFSIGYYFRHGTYHRWYYKQMKRIEIFEKYSINSLNENLDMFASQIDPNTTIPEIAELIQLVKNYHNYLLAL